MAWNGERMHLNGRLQFNNYIILSEEQPQFVTVTSIVEYAF